ncbi:methyl-accepting chemotaxis protein [Rhodoferax sp. GW822-FHT02A01]|uniref:methyl-accepting chemotaxis protein n=1 Tax=Rhodoferax sp. GW822-FHT02A01 TaxID=3141537 RepID=UPI00315D9BE1
MQTNGVLGLGVAVLRRLTFSRKIALIGFLSAMPILVVLWAFFVGTEPKDAFQVVMGLCIVDAAALVYVLVACYVSVTQDIAQMVQYVDRMVAGDLRQPVVSRSKDELGSVLTVVGQLGRTVSAMVANVRGNAAFVAYAGQSLERDSRDLSDRTEQQAANLEQTSASVQELASAVQVNAGTAVSANGHASEVRDAAVGGASAMEEAVVSVEAIQASAKRMDEIVGVIDGLAFQTNILALNAAVEAARAGESGRGFAVVATEVRSLAQRSAASSKEIRELIGASSAQIAASVQKIHAAGSTIKGMVAGIREVAGSMSQISNSSAEQSSGLSEITAAVRQLDEITQRNAQMVGHAVEKAEDMRRRATTLVDSVAMFKLIQGSPEEAVALVQRAVAHRRSGSRDSFLRDLTEPSKGFHDRDMYVFALDEHGTYLAFGGNPSKVGTRVQDIAGIDGEGLLQTIMAQANYEPGWVEYNITNPTTGTVQTKMSYVTAVDDIYLGCGVYKNLVAN